MCFPVSLRLGFPRGKTQHTQVTLLHCSLFRSSESSQHGHLSSGGEGLTSCQPAAVGVVLQVEIVNQWGGPRNQRSVGPPYCRCAAGSRAAQRHMKHAVGCRGVTAQSLWSANSGCHRIPAQVGWAAPPGADDMSSRQGVQPNHERISSHNQASAAERQTDPAGGGSTGLDCGAVLKVTAEWPVVSTYTNGLLP